MTTAIAPKDALAKRIKESYQEWEKGRAPSPSTRDHVNDAVSLLGRGVWSDSDLDQIAEELFDAQADGQTAQTSDEMAEWIISRMIGDMGTVDGRVGRTPHRPRYNADGEKVYRVTAADGKNFTGPSYRLLVPAALARQIGPDREFVLEVTEDGLLYRPVGGESPSRPGWLS
jgi:hypothetical protein